MTAFQTLRELELKQTQKHTRSRKDNAVTCHLCDSQWFVPVKAYMYDDDHQVIVGQDVPTLTGVGYILLQCVRCDTKVAPRILHNARDVAGGDYDYFLDTMEGKEDKRTKGQPQERVPQGVGRGQLQAERL